MGSFRWQRYRGEVRFGRRPEGELIAMVMESDDWCGGFGGDSVVEIRGESMMYLWRCDGSV
jgi:hypothetical protein